ncbi:F-box/LRR-repeat protein 15-like [Physella acuta]|uniref:F-box/LRR-repeat protein 15-like n=1 Tax=Physella acuta TaxID=109671 RepID=UPI0027DB5A85|nr:F-box/LRR-repeat protein 15-like [Physella acuta]XP_059147537.1 F-box/LRR-repeat protein 15-like [Physella acuta]
MFTSNNSGTRSESEMKVFEQKLQEQLVFGDDSVDSEISESNTESYESINLLDLPWEQVLSSFLLPYLSIRDLFKLRAVSSGCRDLVQTHFRLQFHINTSMLGDHFSTLGFNIMTKDCTSLKSICVRGAKSWLTSDAMLPIISRNPRLEKVDLTGCTALSGSTVYSIGVNCTHIKHICLKDCIWLSGDNFLSFWSKKHHIEYLDLSGCWNVDDNLVVQLVQFTPKIKHLLLANLYGLTDRAVGAIAHGCPSLVHLSLRGCWRVTDNSVRLLAQYCSKLKGIQVRECRDITEESLGYLRSRKVLVDRPPPPGPHIFRLERPNNNPHTPRINLVL